MATIILMAAIGAAAFVAGFFARDWANTIDRRGNTDADTDARREYLQLRRIFDQDGDVK